MTGYQEVVTDPSFAEQLVCFTAPMVGNYGVDGDALGVRRAHARAVVMREARGPALDGLAARARRRRADGRRHAVARPASPRPRRDARGGGRDGRRRRRRGARRGARAAGDGGRALVAGVSTRRAVHVHRRGPRARRGRRLRRASARSCAGSRLRALRSTCFPHDVDADTLAGYDGVLLSPGPGDPEPLATRRRRSATCSGGHRCSASASVTSCSRSQPGTRRTSCRSGTAARTTPCSSARPASVLVTRQNHGFAVAAGDDARRTHISLYDGTVEGLALPASSARAPLQFHPEAAPGPHDAWPIARELGRRVAAV